MYLHLYYRPGQQRPPAIAESAAGSGTVSLVYSLMPIEVAFNVECLVTSSIGTSVGFCLCVYEHMGLQRRLPCEALAAYSARFARDFMDTIGWVRNPLAELTAQRDILEGQ